MFIIPGLNELQIVWTTQDTTICKYTRTIFRSSDNTKLRWPQMSSPMESIYATICLFTCKFPGTSPTDTASPELNISTQELVNLFFDLAWPLRTILIISGSFHPLGYNCPKSHAYSVDKSLLLGLHWIWRYLCYYCVFWWCCRMHRNML